MGEKESPSVAVERALRMLEAVGESSAGMTNAELSRKVGVPKSTASYILRTLEQHGYLRREMESGRYRLGLRVLSLGRSVLGGLDVREAALPYLRALAERLKLTVHLAAMDHGQAVYIEKVEVPGFIKMDTWVGRRMEVYTTSVGKALVAWWPKEEVETILRERGMKKRTPKTITNVGEYLRELEKVRKLGYAVDDEENNLNVRCVAAPIFGADGKVEASIGVSGATSQVTKGHVAKVAEAAMEAARRVSHQLGYVKRSGS